MHITQIQAFFFKAMLHGWASGKEAIDCPQMSGYKKILFWDDAFTLADRYCVGQDGLKSAGSTTIWFQHSPVWVMHYGGQYEGGAIPFLKNALLQTYTKEHFIGGRGPLTYVEGALVYNNRAQGDFAKFDGREQVYDSAHGRPLGFHDYSGMALF